MLVVCVFLLDDDDDDDHGIRRANTARALARWWRLVEATKPLYRSMRLASYQPRGMAVGFFVDYSSFYFL